MGLAPLHTRARDRDGGKFVGLIHWLAGNRSCVLFLSLVRGDGQTDGRVVFLAVCLSSLFELPGTPESEVFVLRGAPNLTCFVLDETRLRAEASKGSVWRAGVETCLTMAPWALVRALSA